MAGCRPISARHDNLMTNGRVTFGVIWTNSYKFATLQASFIWICYTYSYFSFTDITNIYFFLHFRRRGQNIREHARESVEFGVFKQWCRNWRGYTPSNEMGTRSWMTTTQIWKEVTVTFLKLLFLYSIVDTEEDKGKQTTASNPAEICQKSNSQRSVISLTQP
jgi:hypothetical protein